MEIIWFLIGCLASSFIFVFFLFMLGAAAKRSEDRARDMFLKELAQKSGNNRG